MTATCHTKSVLSLRQKLSPRQKLWLGFAWCPILTWMSFGGQLLLFRGIDWTFPLAFSHPSLTLIVFGVLSWCASWAGVAGFSGFGAAFFWNDSAPELEPDPERETSTSFCSMIMAWAPAMLFGFWYLFLLPFLVFVAFYYAGLGRGYTFWNSRNPHQWVGDFSEPD